MLEIRAKILSEIKDILEARTFSGGRAAKLRGKLFFISGHFQGKRGQSNFGALTERQHTSGRDIKIATKIRRSLLSWLHLPHKFQGVRAAFQSLDIFPADVVMYSGASAPEARPSLLGSDEDACPKALLGSVAKYWALVSLARRQ